MTTQPPMSPETISDAGEAAMNTDRELWRSEEGEHPYCSIHVTEYGGVGINLSGHVIVRPLADWHALALKDRVAVAPEAAVEGTRDDDDEAYLVLVLINAMHEGADGFPLVAMSDLSDDQALRARRGVRAITAALARSAPAPSDALRLAVEECREAFAERALLGKVTRGAQEMVDLCDAALTASPAVGEGVEHG